MAKRYFTIYCDESDRKGRYFSNFFGGILLETSQQQEITELLNRRKQVIGLIHELKWQYIDASCVDRYIDFINYYFEFVATSRLRVRIMFTQNMRVPRGLTRRHYDEQYFLLYYQFIKHAFGIGCCNPNLLDTVYFHILADQIPHKEERVSTFKEYLCKITNTRSLRNKKLNILRHNISDVDSKDHVILQGLDIILGAMNARLNDKLKEKPEGKYRRGKRTVAKEKIYKQINRLIRVIYPHFNIGTSTACKNGPADRWQQPYRHWLFMPTAYNMDHNLGKKKPQ